MYKTYTFSDPSPSISLHVNIICHQNGKKGLNIENVWNQCFLALTTPPLPFPLKEYVLYTRLNVDNYRRPLGNIKSQTKIYPSHKTQIKNECTNLCKAHLLFNIWEIIFQLLCEKNSINEFVAWVARFPLIYMLIMPHSHCAESTAEWGQIDNSSLFDWSFLVIPGQSSNDNDNDNQFEQCSSRPCSFGRSVRKFWTCSKNLGTSFVVMCIENV